MSKRLRVLFDELEYQELKRLAQQARLSLGGWVRQDLLLRYPGLLARDTLHLGLMKKLEIGEIVSFDKDYDRVSWVKRRF